MLRYVLFGSPGRFYSQGGVKNNFLRKEILNRFLIYNRWPVAKAGMPFILLGLTLTFLAIYAAIPVLPFPLFALTLLTIYFFRDPERQSNGRPEEIVSPADGKIIGIETLKDEASPIGAPCIKISIFMSVFDVHVNRIPLTGVIAYIKYRKGAFFSADLDKASSENERNSITIDTQTGEKIAVVQIAGLVARRISCWVREGDSVQKGQRFGLIRFGSRVELFLPAGSVVLAKMRQRVVAGKTLLGVLT
jgi:phosphatidylserine decarboxylase